MLLIFSKVFKKLTYIKLFQRLLKTFKNFFQKITSYKNINLVSKKGNQQNMQLFAYIQI